MRFIWTLWVYGIILFPLWGQPETTANRFYIQGNFNRTAAEWEPALGTMITWPLCVPYKLAVELANDNHLFILVNDKASREEAKTWFEKWGFRPEKTSFIIAPQGIDAWWTRDWGPSAIFKPESKMYLGDGKYVFATPNSGLSCNDALQFIYYDDKKNMIRTDVDDNATEPLGNALDIPVLDLPFITTGGNFITDGLGTAFSSCIMLNENRFYGVSEERFFKLNDSLAGIKNYHILSNFETRGIQHLDCFMKLLDEERILVAEPPVDHELWDIYESIVEKELKPLKTVYGRPYEIHRIKIGRYQDDLLAAYTNSIIVNKTIYVPLFKIREDSLALKTWRELMPGYTVKGFTFSLNEEPLVSEKMQKHYNSGYGWNYGDALHCRTRAIWDPDMLLISVNRLPKKVDPSKPLTIFASILDYSKKGLKPGSATLFWRVKGELEWVKEALLSEDNGTAFSTTIPAKPVNHTLEYFVSVSSLSGRTETMPRTAPAGFYTVER